MNHVPFTRVCLTCQRATDTATDTAWQGKDTSKRQSFGSAFFVWKRPKKVLMCGALGGAGVHRIYTPKGYNEIILDNKSKKAYACIQNVRRGFEMRGGKREGAGRPKGSMFPPNKRRKQVSVRLPVWLSDWLQNHPESSGRLIERALIAFYQLKGSNK
jgi:hypothetical protein